MKPHVYLPAVMVALLLVTTHSEAHDIAYPAYLQQAHAHSVVVFPRWLRQDAAFRHWYARNHYRYSRHPGWQRLYDRYRLDYRRSRHARHAHRRCRHATRYGISYLRD